MLNFYGEPFDENADFGYCRLFIILNAEFYTTRLNSKHTTSPTTEFVNSFFMEHKDFYS